MAMGDDNTASPLNQAAMLGLWEANARGRGVQQGLALLGACLPNMARDDLAAISIGQRDGMLLDLHDQLFGSRIECRTDCAGCGTPIEATFDSSEIRFPSCPSTTFTATLDDTIIEARLPDSRDLGAIEGMNDVDEAWRTLAERCVISARSAGKDVPIGDIPHEMIEALDASAAETDPQADIVIGLACPDCGAKAQLPFDIVRQIWARLDHWARAMLAAVDVLAARYGWSEAEILALGPARRQRYLDLIGGEVR